MFFIIIIIINYIGNKIKKKRSLKVDNTIFNNINYGLSWNNRYILIFNKNTVKEVKNNTIIGIIKEEFDRINISLN